MRGKQTGFSLVELMVVVGISGLILTISFPSLRRFRETVYAQSAAQQTLIEVRAAQSRAIASGEIVHSGRFAFARSGSALPGGSGTSPLGSGKTIVVSSAGRVRLE